MDSGYLLVSTTLRCITLHETSPLTSAKLLEMSELSFLSHDKTLFTLHGEKHLIDFVYFLIENNPQITGLQFISHIQIPKAKELKKIIQEYHDTAKYLQELHQNLESIYINAQKEYIIKSVSLNN